MKITIFITMISAVHGWTINPAVDVQRKQRQRQRRRHQSLFVLSAATSSSSSSSTFTATTTTTTDNIIDEEILLSDHAELESFISTSTATADYTDYNDYNDYNDYTAAIINDDNNKNNNSRSNKKVIDAGRDRPTYYAFNKLIVDTMYHIISFLYPITGSSADNNNTEKNINITADDDEKLRFGLELKHFYIVEIISRVPYFAYLSVMHLQETFGQRYYKNTNTGNTGNTNTNTNTNNNNYDTYADQVRIQKMRLFYAQADNELHHLLIIENLLAIGIDDGDGDGDGDTNDNDNDNTSFSISVIDRVIAHSLALMYYWYVIFISLTHGNKVGGGGGGGSSSGGGGEQAVYNLNELIVDRAYNTYDTFIKQNEKELRSMNSIHDVPDIARKYYEIDNQYLLNLIRHNDVDVKVDGDDVDDVGKHKQLCVPQQQKQNNKPNTKQKRKHQGKPLLNLYDVFVNIRDDEMEHYKTLCDLQNNNNNNNNLNLQQQV